MLTFHLSCAAVSLMILAPPNHNKLNEVFCLHDYHPYKMPDKSLNPLFNDVGGMILNIKDGRSAAIDHFAKEIDRLACGTVIVAVVPGHDPATAKSSGMAMVAQRVAAMNKRIDGTSLLERHIKIEKLAQGGSRAIKVHLDSVRVVDKARVLNGASVLLLDDVATSNNSLLACKQLLQTAGAKEVQMFALGRTVRW